jgi:basic membrane protein A
LISFCSEKKETLETANTKTIEKTKLKIGLVISGGGLGDGSFNDMQYKGLIDISRKYSDDVETIYIQPEKHEHDPILASFNELIERKCDFIIGAGWEKIEPMEETASKNPDVNFVLLDDFAKLRDNVSSIIFSQNEGSFVVGVLSARMTKTNKIGFIGGMNVLVIEDFRKGFEEGIKYINPSIELIADYCSFIEDDDWTGWESPSKAKKIADKMYKKQGVDIIYSVAGLSGNGIIESAKENNKFVIGVDSDQDHMAKGLILTSMVKRLDNAVFDICEKFIKGEFEGGKDYLYGYKDGGVGITEMKYTKNIIPKEVLEELKDVENKISNGEIVVSRVLKRQ